MELLLIFGSFVLAFILILVTVPPIVAIARAKKLYEPFEDRKVHTEIVPPLGGVAIFIAFILSTIIATDGLSFDSLKYIIAAVIIMFFIGLKDDILVISAHKKFLVQMFAAVLLIALGNIRFTNLHGIFGIHEIGYLTSVSLSLLAMIGIINAFNLIDGIDGLASGLAITGAFVFGIWFYLSENYQLSIMAFALVGSLSGFFLYNVFGKRNKLFMGDTGSLIVGIVMSTLVIKFNELNLVADSVAFSSAPALSFAVVSVPIIDTLRVLAIRLSRKKSPFSPDKNHVHHYLLELIPNSHLKVTLIIVAVNALMIAGAVLLDSFAWNVNIQFFLLVSVGILISFIPSALSKSKYKRKGYSSATTM
ncbi:MraY family glycosyltransferase [Maribellus sediminis]|uniref:MraY family glycosyltransferase n=1 Tax=Maribellus sediminis TaxID=2696285 RepID=UPI0014302BDC|nr:MraY family glycosyltransferase [Maribellus sediminis]